MSTSPPEDDPALGSGPGSEPGSESEAEALLGAARAAFEARGWVYHVVAGQPVIEAAFDAHHTRVALHVQVFPPIGAVSVVSRSASPVPASHRDKVNELLMAANQSLTVGNFEPSPGYAEVLFRATNLFPGGEGDPPVIARLVHAGVAEIDRLTPVLAIVLRTPADQLHTINPAALLERDDLVPPPPADG